MLQFYFSHYKKCGRSSLSLVKQFYVIDIFPFSHFFWGGGLLPDGHSSRFIPSTMAVWAEGGRKAKGERKHGVVVNPL
jgi:hypothetical protein